MLHHGFREGLAMKRQRDLHAGEENEEERQQWTGNPIRIKESVVEELGIIEAEEQRGDPGQIDEQGADRHDDGGPFYDERKPANREIHEMHRGPIQPAQPCIDDKDQIDLDGDAEEVSEQRGEPVDEGGPADNEQPRRHLVEIDEALAEEGGREDCGNGARQDAGVDQRGRAAKAFAQCLPQGAVMILPIQQEHYARDGREGKGGDHVIEEAGERLEPIQPGMANEKPSQIRIANRWLRAS